MNPYKIRKNFNVDRSKYIGASDMPIIALSREFLKPYHNTRLEIYLQKRREIDIPPAGLQADIGNLLEPITLEMFLCERYGVMPNIRQKEWKNLAMESADGYIECIRYTEFKHPEYPFLCVHPDMLVIGDGQKPYLVQAKTHKYFSAFGKEKGKNFSLDDFSFRGLPLFTYFQIQFEMLIADVDTCFVELESDNSFYLYGKEKKIKIQNGETVETWNYTGIPADKDLQARLLAAAVNFWKDCKEGNTPTAEIKDIEKYYTEIEPRSAIVADPDEIARLKKEIARYEELSAALKQTKTEMDNIKSGFKLLMGYNPEKPDTRTLAEILKTPEGEELAAFSRRSGSLDFVAPLKVLEESSPNEIERLKAMTAKDLIDFEPTETQAKQLEKIGVMPRMFTKEAVLKQLEKKAPDIFTALSSAGLVRRSPDTFSLSLKGE